MKEFILLGNDDIEGERQLEIFKVCGTKAEISDYAILLGGGVYVPKNNSNTDIIKNRVGFWWTRDGNYKYNFQYLSENEIVTSENCMMYPYYNETYYVDWNGQLNVSSPKNKTIGIRPVYSDDFEKLIKSQRSNFVKIGENVFEYELWEWPQTIVNKADSNILEHLYTCHQLNDTGIFYTYNNSDNKENIFRIKPSVNLEYEFNNSKFVRVIALNKYKNQVLSNGEIVQPGKAYWVKVDPIIWLIDSKEMIALSKKIIMAGIPFLNNAGYKGTIGDFHSSDIKMYMDLFMTPEMIISPYCRNNIERRSKIRTKTSKSKYGNYN